MTTTTTTTSTKTTKTGDFMTLLAVLTDAGMMNGADVYRLPRNMNAALPRISELVDSYGACPDYADASSRAKGLIARIAA